MDDILFLVDKLADKVLDYLHISLNDYNRISISKKYQKMSILHSVHDKINGRLLLVSVGGVKTKENLEKNTITLN